jgi:putative ABC transport system permease protein
MNSPALISTPPTPEKRASRWPAAAPLARRNLLADPRRLARSVAGVGFAVLLMMLELGFRDGYIESMLLMMRQLDGDIMLVNSALYQFDRSPSFPRRQLAAAEGVEGVESARPFYVERIRGIWKNPQTQQLFAVPVFAFDPDKPVLRLPEVAQHLAELRQPNAIMFDRNARADLGVAEAGTETELAHRAVRVVATFWLGPNFFSDGDILMSGRNFFTFFGGPGEDNVPDPEIGVIKLRPGYDPTTALKALRAVMPAGLTVLTKPQLLNQEARLHARYSPVGPIFNVGAIVGFFVGMLISYQILFTEISDQLPQYATLKAIGYTTPYLATVVLQQALFYALVAYAPAWLLGVALFHVIGGIAVGPLQMTLSLTLTTLALTLAMCVAAGMIAMRKVIVADPAEVF